MRHLIPVVLVAILLAGCLSSPPKTETSTSASSRSAVTPIQAPLAKETDTLHLLAPPDLSPVAPAGKQDVAVALPSAFTGGLNAISNPNGAFLPTWSLTLPNDLGLLNVTATLWVDVEGNVVGDPIPTANGCFWGLQVAIHGAAQPVTSVCGVEPLQVPNGVRALVLQFPLAQGSFTQGTTLDFILNSNASFQDPAARIDLLTGSTGHDSRLTVEGMKVSLPQPSIPGLLGAT